MVPVTTNQLGYPPKKFKQSLDPTSLAACRSAGFQANMGSKKSHICGSSHEERRGKHVGNMWEDPMENLREKSWGKFLGKILGTTMGKHTRRAFVTQENSAISPKSPWNTVNDLITVQGSSHHSTTEPALHC